MDTNYALVLVIGILASSVVHFSQGMMRLAIMRKEGGAVKSRTRWIYIAGIALNFTAPLWVILANRFGRQHDIIPLGMLVGMLGGVFLALDSLLKGVAQYDSGAAAFLPTTGMGLTFFVVSFIGAGLAFGMTQLEHIRSAKASETIAGYDVAYVALPVLIIPLATGESAGISVLCYSGLVCLALGIYYMRR